MLKIHILSNIISGFKNGLKVLPYVLTEVRIYLGTISMNKHLKIVEKNDIASPKLQIALSLIYFATKFTMLHSP